MVAVQAEGCAPIVKAFKEGHRHAEPWENAETIAAGIRVPAAVGDFLILDAVRESDGFAVAVSDQEITSLHRECALKEGILLCPEGAATLAALKKELISGRIKKTEQIMLFNCATGLKYPMKTTNEKINLKKTFDMESLSHLNFAIGKAYEDMNKHKEAFYHLDRANKIKNTLINYNFQDEKNNSFRIVNIFTCWL